MLDLSNFGLKREAEIVEVVARNGWDYLRSRLAPKPSEGQVAEPSLPLPDVLRQILIDLGPTFVKLGQVLSTRPDLLPAEYIRVLETLQDDVPPVGWDIIRPVIEMELKRPISEVFVFVEDRAIAAGSVAQVHKAQLISGEIVALKVQRPGIRQVIEMDLNVLQTIVNRFGKGKLGQMYDLQGLLDEFRQTIRGELDFRREAKNTEGIGQNIARSDYWAKGKMRAPAVYDDLTTERLLVLEWVNGTSLTKATIPAAHKVQIARWVALMVLQQFLIDGFFHADPHPGNLFYVPDGSDFHVVLLDYGMVSRIDPRTRRILIDMFVGIIAENPRQITRTVLELGFASQPVNIQAIENAYDRILRRFYTSTLQEVNLAELIRELIEVLQQHRIQLPGSVGMLVKALVNAEGVARTLDPQFPVVEVVSSLVSKALRQRFMGDSPLQLLQDVIYSTMYSAQSLTRIPVRIDSLIDSLERSELGFNWRWHNQPEFQRSLGKYTRRLCLALLAVGGVLAGSNLLTAGTGAIASAFTLTIAGHTFLIAGFALAVWLVIELFLRP